MPLVFPPPPEDALPALQSGLQRVAEMQRLDPRGGGVLALPATPRFVRPYPVYTLGLNDLVAGKGFEDALLGAWRYLIVDGDQVRLAAEVQVGSSGGCRFAALCGAVAGIEEAFGLAESLPEVVGGYYEVRSLVVLGPYVTALWLKDQIGTEDRFLALPLVFAPFQAQTPYSTSDLLPILHQQAARKAVHEQAINGGIPTLPQDPVPDPIALTLARRSQ